MRAIHGPGRIEHTFYSLGDVPVLFVWVDGTDARYLCSCCKLHEEWLVGQVLESALTDLIDDKVTIREVFESRCEVKAFAVWDGEKFDVKNGFPVNALPKAGAMLELEHEKDGPYRRALSLQCKRGKAACLPGEKAPGKIIGKGAREDG